MERKYQLRKLAGCLIGACPSVYEITPENSMCPGATCPSVFEITPENSMCIITACPAIEEYKGKYLIVGNELPSEGDYDVIRIPTGILAKADRKKLKILREKDGQTDIAGKKVDIRALPKEISFLEKRVGEGEMLISVPNELIDDMKK